MKVRGKFGPRVRELTPGEVFTYKGDVYLRLYVTKHDDPIAANVVDGKLLWDNTGILVTPQPRVVLVLHED